MSTENLGKVRSDFAERLRRLRLAKGWTQEDLARKLDVSNGSVGYWETGVNVPRPLVMKKMSGLFGVEVEDLLGVKQSSDSLRETLPDKKRIESGTSPLSWMEATTLERTLMDLANRLHKCSKGERKHILGNIIEVVTELETREVIGADHGAGAGGESQEIREIAKKGVGVALKSLGVPGPEEYRKPGKVVSTNEKADEPKPGAVKH